MSCAWPDPDPEHRHAAEFCENGAKAVAEEATHDRATPEFFARHSIAELDAHDEYWLGQQGRITHPMVKRPGGTHYEPIEWDEAFATHRRASCSALATPDEAIFYTSGRASNEAAFAYQLFVRALRHQQPARLLEHVPRVDEHRAGGVDRHRQGQRHASTTSTSADADRHRRPEPRAPTTRACCRRSRSPSATAPRSSRSTRCARPGCTTSRTRRCRAASSGTGTEHRRPAPARSRSTATWRSSRPSARCWSSGTRSTTTSSSGTRRASTQWARPRPRRRLGPGRRDATGLSAAQQITEAAEMLRDSDAHRLLLGDGPDAAPQRRRDDQGGRQPRLRAGQHRQARRGPVPGPRPLQRPGRPHDGHLGASAGALPRRAAEGVRLRPAARERARHRRLASGRCATARPTSSSASAATSCRPSPDTDVAVEAMRKARD